ncbi:hypothetical protein ACFU1R_20260 [Priestia megaterium]|uniref:hypothetical protein n=1 Tax=Priestia megaterium TaxID=1404 RepID=UPI00366F5A77
MNEPYMDWRHIDTSRLAFPAQNRRSPADLTVILYIAYYPIVATLSSELAP